MAVESFSYQVQFIGKLNVPVQGIVGSSDIQFQVWTKQIWAKHWGSQMLH